MARVIVTTVPDSKRSEFARALVEVVGLTERQAEQQYARISTGQVAYLAVTDTEVPPDAAIRLHQRLESAGIPVELEAGCF